MVLVRQDLESGCVCVCMWLCSHGVITSDDIDMVTPNPTKVVTLRQQRRSSVFKPLNKGEDIQLMLLFFS